MTYSSSLSKSSLQLELGRGKRYFTVNAQLEATMFCFGFVKPCTHMHLKMVVLSTGTFMKHKDDACAPLDGELTSLLSQVRRLNYTFCFWPALNMIDMEAC